MKKHKRKLQAFVLTICMLLMPLTVFASDGAEHVSGLYGTLWALLPPVIAIALALITKEVYSSLFIGILVGGFFYANGNPEIAMIHILVDGMIGSLSDS